MVAARASEAVAKKSAAAPDVTTIEASATDKTIGEGLPPPNGQFSAKSFVLSGVFDDPPGAKSVGLTRGKGGVKELIERYGGRVVSALSRKVDYLVGAAPGAGKVAQATKLGKDVVDLAGLLKMVAGEAAEGAKIDEFSRGFGTNGLAMRIGSNALDELKAKAATKRIAGPVAEPVTEKKAKVEGVDA